MDIDKARSRFTGADHVATEMPVEIVSVGVEGITDLDVRDDLRNGREPFSRIMEAQQLVPAGGVLRLRATFEPVPLYHALKRSGFSHWTQRLADDDWEVWFYRGDFARTVKIDVRGLEPPEPMQRTLEMLEQIDPDTSLVQVNSRVPQMLLPFLEDRGFEYVLISEDAGTVTGLIRRIKGAVE